MSGGQGGFMQGSQDSPGKDQRNGPQTLRPVTIYQVIEADQVHNDAEFMIDGHEAKEVTLVACVRNIVKTSTSTSYLVEDGTGQIDCRRWSDAESGGDENEPTTDEITLNSYVRLLGTLKTFSGKRHIACQNIRPITDKNEILFHAIETIHVHLLLTKGPPGASHNNTSHNQSQSDNHYDNKPRTIAEHDPFASLPDIQRRIMTWFKSSEEKSDEGVYFAVLQRRIAPQMSADDFRLEVDMLCTEGNLYTTLDDDHFLPCQ